MPPGKEGKIELAVEHTDGYVGEVAKSARVSTNDSKLPTFTLTLRARFKAEQPANLSTPHPAAKRIGPLLVEPADRWTSSVLSGSVAATNLYLVNSQPTPIHIKNVISEGDSFSAKLQPIQEGQRYELHVATNPMLKPGRYTQTLRVVTDNQSNPEVTIDLELTVYPKVFATPTSIIMPALPSSSNLGGINWPIITVRKLREGSLQIKKFSSTLPFLKLELVADSEGQLYRIHISVDQQKVTPGAYNGSIRIETNDPEVPLLEVPIKGSFN